MMFGSSCCALLLVALSVSAQTIAPAAATTQPPAPTISAANPAFSAPTPPELLPPSQSYVAPTSVSVAPLRCSVVAGGPVETGECILPFTYKTSPDDPGTIFNECPTLAQAVPQGGASGLHSFELGGRWCYVPQAGWSHRDDVNTTYVKSVKSINSFWGRCDDTGCNAAMTVPSTPPVVPPRCVIRGGVRTYKLKGWASGYRKGFQPGAQTGAACDFPFEYQGITMWDCADKDDPSIKPSGVGWCFSDKVNKIYGLCACDYSASPTPVPSGTPSALPLTQSPTTVAPTLFSCHTQYMWTEDKMRELHPEFETPVTKNGVKCVFPFIFKRLVRWDCAERNKKAYRGHGWCFTNSERTEWGVCNCDYSTPSPTKEEVTVNPTSSPTMERCHHSTKLGYFCTNGFACCVESDPKVCACDVLTSSPTAMPTPMPVVTTVAPNSRVRTLQPTAKMIAAPSANSAYSKTPSLLTTIPSATILTASPSLRQSPMPTAQPSVSTLDIDHDTMTKERTVSVDVVRAMLVLEEASGVASGVHQPSSLVGALLKGGSSSSSLRSDIEQAVSGAVASALSLESGAESQLLPWLIDESDVLAQVVGVCTSAAPCDFATLAMKRDVGNTPDSSDAGKRRSLQLRRQEQEKSASFVVTRPNRRASTKGVIAQGIVLDIRVLVVPPESDLFGSRRGFDGSMFSGNATAILTRLRTLLLTESSALYDTIPPHEQVRFLPSYYNATLDIKLLRIVALLDETDMPTTSEGINGSLDSSPEGGKSVSGLSSSKQWSIVLAIVLGTACGLAILVVALRFCLYRGFKKDRQPSDVPTIPAQYPTLHCFNYFCCCLKSIFEMKNSHRMHRVEGSRPGARTDEYGSGTTRYKFLRRSGSSGGFPVDTGSERAVRLGRKLRRAEEVQRARYGFERESMASVDSDRRNEGRRIGESELGQRASYGRRSPNVVHEDDEFDVDQIMGRSPSRLALLKPMQKEDGMVFSRLDSGNPHHTQQRQHGNMKRLAEMRQPDFDGFSGSNDAALANPALHLFAPRMGSEAQLELANLAHLQFESEARADREHQGDPNGTGKPPRALEAITSLDGDGAGSMLANAGPEFRIDLSQLRLGAVIGHGGNGRIFRATYCGSDVAVKEIFSIVSRVPARNSPLFRRGTRTQLPPCEFTDTAAVGVGNGSDLVAIADHAHTEEAQEFFQEFEHLRLLRHPNIIQLFGATVARSVDTGGARYMLVMELAQCSLRDVLASNERRWGSSLQLYDALNLSRQICAGGAFIHGLKPSPLIHFDIKPGNILLDRAGTAKLCDLGIARFCSRGKGSAAQLTITSLRGTPSYMAPEMLRGDSNQVSTTVDVYAYGIVLWEILHRRPPHPRTWTVAKLFNKVMVEDYRPPIDPDMPRPLARLISMCWALDPTHRPPLQRVLNALDLSLQRATLKPGAAKKSTMDYYRDQQNLENRRRRRRFCVGDSVYLWDSKLQCYLSGCVSTRHTNGQLDVEFDDGQKPALGVLPLDLLPRKIDCFSKSSINMTWRESHGGHYGGQGDSRGVVGTINASSCTQDVPPDHQNTNCSPGDAKVCGQERYSSQLRESQAQELDQSVSALALAHFSRRARNARAAAEAAAAARRQHQAGSGEVYESMDMDTDGADSITLEDDAEDVHSYGKALGSVDGANELPSVSHEDTLMSAVKAANSTTTKELRGNQMRLAIEFKLSRRQHSSSDEFSDVGTNEDEDDLQDETSSSAEDCSETSDSEDSLAKDEGSRGAFHLMRSGRLHHRVKGEKESRVFCAPSMGTAAGENAGVENTAVATAAVATTTGLDHAQLLRVTEIGRGSGGSVDLMVHLGTFALYAVKRVGWSNFGARQRAASELKTLASTLNPTDADGASAFLSGPVERSGCANIVSYYGAYLDQERQCLNMVHVMEFMEGGSLQDMLDSGVHSPPSSVLASIAHDVCSGLAFLHTQNVAHLDIKPANVLLTLSGVAKLADFGLARQLKAARKYTTTSFAGTTAYMAPERLRGESYTFAADIWSAGLTLLAVAVGRYPIAPCARDVENSLGRNHSPAAAQPVAHSLAPKRAAVSVRFLSESDSAKQESGDCVRSKAVGCPRGSCNSGQTTAASVTESPMHKNCRPTIGLGSNMVLPPEPFNATATRTAAATVADRAEEGATTGRSFWSLLDRIERGPSLVASALDGHDSQAGNSLESTPIEQRNFLEKCLQCNALDRPDAAELMRHPWLKSGRDCCAHGMISREGRRRQRLVAPRDIEAARVLLTVIARTICTELYRRLELSGARSAHASNPHGGHHAVVISRRQTRTLARHVHLPVALVQTELSRLSKRVRRPTLMLMEDVHTTLPSFPRNSYGGANVEVVMGRGSGAPPRPARMMQQQVVWGGTGAMEHDPLRPRCHSGPPLRRRFLS